MPRKPGSEYFEASSPVNRADAQMLWMRSCRAGSLLLLLAGAVAHTCAQTNQSFNGRPWNVSSGNLSVSFIQASPIGAFPRPDFLEAPPSVDSQRHLKSLGLVANEDYIAWGAVEPLDDVRRLTNFSTGRLGTE